MSDLPEPVLLSEIPLDSIKTYLRAKFTDGVLVRTEGDKLKAYYWGMGFQKAAQTLREIAEEIEVQNIVLPPPPARTQ